ncbi:hypothetical protein [Telmatospirillum sp.]|uniref:hypothetical protein n=1 Tax=Telmatospirillum sp. TaxID=2079197 RepID=UPI00284D0088|nr:hypothetical protein [Telmatospirillum sp.]MDR3440104.1 hypothetical protein [Telmatospirillum sp.]
MTPIRSAMISLTVAGILLTGATAQGADLSKELGTAITHAGLAVGSADLKLVQTHLHHVVNCLVGPGGNGFDASQANPCKDQGSGAIPDAPPDKTKVLQTALTSAQEGLATTNFDKAKEKATETQAALKRAQ